MQNRGRNTAAHTKIMHRSISRRGALKVTKKDIFKEYVYYLKEITNKLQKTMNKLIHVLFQEASYDHGICKKKERKTCGHMPYLLYSFHLEPLFNNHIPLFLKKKY